MNKINIEYKDTKATLLYPGSAYSRSRFDWTGIVEQLTAGSVPFLGKEAEGDYKGSEGIGLSSEFGIKTPLSYWRTLPGREFMKIGVGALTRDSVMPYSFFRDYPVRPFETEVQAFENKVEFSQKSCSAGPYAYDYVKTIELSDRVLTINYHLMNRGEKRIRTEEYCHNFFRPGDRDLTSRLSVETSIPVRSRKTVGQILMPREGLIQFNGDPREVFYMYGLLKDRPGDFSWKITDEESGTSVRGIEDFPVSKFALWGMKHVISPETFHTFTLESGDDLKWSRKYLFEV